MTTVPFGHIESQTPDRYCVGCGYNLRGLGPGHCPECGRVSDGREHSGVRVPWAHRTRIGTFEAYWRTVLLVCFRPGAFAARFHWPHVRHHDSPAFRCWTIACAVASTTLAAAGAAWHLRFSNVAMAVLLGALAPSAAVFFYAATGLTGFFTGPRPLSDTSEEAFRAGIVNDYASAALAWTPLPAGVVCAGAGFAKMIGPEVAGYLFPVALLLAVAIGVLWLGDVLVAFGEALSLGPAGLLLAAVLFPVRCAGLAILTAVFVFVPLACCVGGLISLRP